MVKKIVIVITLITFIASGLVVFSAFKLNSRPELSENAIIHIPSGTSHSRAIELLNQKGILKPGFLFLPIIKLYSIASGSYIHQGYYRFHSGLKNLEIIYSIFNGKNLYTIKVTFPEGLNIKQFASIAQKRLNIDSAEFAELCQNRDFISSLNIEAPTLEGWLMPDTYMLYWKDAPESIIKRLVSAQNRLWENRFEARSQEIKMSRIKVLTLASIIEAETKYQPEKKRISGVYHNRLKKGMLLQADPTVQYALGVRRRLLYRDLTVESPYNTYLYPGLPPGPINSPGELSIEAALFPEEHNYLYFVAAGDELGSHNFSRDYVGHQQNISDYKRNIRNSNNK